MTCDAALAQLLDMGIPRGRARAALKRSKGDVMSAAERVFAGEFDEISSDDEGQDDMQPVPGALKDQNFVGLQTAEQMSSTSTICNTDAKRTRPSSSVIDDEHEIIASDSETDEGDNYDQGFEEEDVVMSSDKQGVDPYAGIFFSKNRLEKIITPLKKEYYALVALPANRSKKSGPSTNGWVRILDKGEWMSGCPEGNEQSLLFQLYSVLEEGRIACPSGCGHSFLRRKQNFFVLFPDLSMYLAHLSANLRSTCPNCQIRICLACGERTGKWPSERGSAPGRGTPHSLEENSRQDHWPQDDVLLHCPNIQGVILGVGLRMIELAFAGEGEKGQNTAVALESHAGSDDRDDDTEDYYDQHPDIHNDAVGSFMSHRKGKGVGYAGTVSEDRSGQIRAERAQKEADDKTSTLLSQVSVYLPHLNREGGARVSDHLVHPTALAHVRRRSAFVNDLLRNDSLMDMSKRGNLYRVLFNWLEAVASHEALASMLAMPQMRPIRTEPAPHDSHFVMITYEGSSSPRELLENCVIQAQAALKGLESDVDPEDVDEVTEEDLRLTNAQLNQKKGRDSEACKENQNIVLKQFCLRIISTAETIDGSLVETKGKPFERARDASTNEAASNIYEDWAGRARFQYCDMSIGSENSSNIAYKHAFNGVIQKMVGMDLPKRSLAIAKELAILTTSLPVAWHSTIFLRVDIARVDVLKAMIIGPEGTPYENGCFIFDIFLPADYNISCPQVKAMTTNGGQYRYNPNLYADGKVCLSLLGTWGGPGWISGQSTLLQVLVSIQSLILCEEPYLNEPAYANESGSTNSKAYSANVRRMVLADAMANNIKCPPFPFENEIRTHFRLKAEDVRKQITRWKALDDGQAIKTDDHSPHSGTQMSKPSKGTPFDQAAEAVRQMLNKLERQEGIRQDASGQEETKNPGQGIEGPKSKE
ncbi:hypothetical protein IAR55_005099 [Kwoniella newhampshirensis]|uniref:UBC core domain-containing protein n=1 Tax=Kwoniella newhampshirensis TaxID=1651941 RepID=A0AAW0Z036_9TREE